MTGSKQIRNLELASDAGGRRRHARSRKHGSPKVTVRRTSSAETITASLWDFSYGGIGMEVAKPLTVGEEIELATELLSSDYSMRTEATGRVVHCRPVGRDLYRVGVAFISVTYHPLEEDARAEELL